MKEEMRKQLQKNLDESASKAHEEIKEDIKNWIGKDVSDKDIDAVLWALRMVDTTTLIKLKKIKTWRDRIMSLE